MRVNNQTARYTLLDDRAAAEVQPLTDQQHQRGMLLRDAISCYHNLLDEQTAAETMQRLADQQRRRGLMFGERPVCNLLRPRFLTPQQYRALCARANQLMGAFGRLHMIALESEAMQVQLGLSGWQRQLIAFDRGHGAPSMAARLAAFFDPASDTLSVTGYDGESAAMLGYGDGLAELWLGLPAMADFTRRYHVTPLPVRHHLLNALLAAHRRRFGRDQVPRIAIVEWREAAGFAEIALIDQYIRSQGIPCIVVDPRELEYVGGKLYGGNFQITLVYRRAPLGELIRWGGEHTPLLRAVREGAACMVEPFRSQLLSKRATLAALSDERNAWLFTLAQRQAIADNIPWTRVVAERQTEYGGRTIDLVPFVVSRREWMLLKPNDDKGGRGPVLGWECDDTTWERAVLAALEVPTVVQERVAVPEEEFPLLDAGKLKLARYRSDIGPLAFGGAFVDGCTSRIASGDLLSLAGGASLAPTFLVDPR